MPILRQLTEAELRLDEALNHLREQQDLVGDADCHRTHTALVKLLSNRLRLYCYLEGQRNGLIEQLGENLPLYA